MKKAVLLLIGFTLFFSISCSKKQIVKKYFILDSALESADSSAYQSLPYFVQVRPFQISKAYNQMRIALRTRSNELNYYFYNSWAENPQSALRFFTWKKCKQSGLFQKCELQSDTNHPDYIISGTVEQIERVAEGNRHSAHLKMILELTDVHSNEIVVRHRFDRFEPIKKNANMNIFAANLSRIIDEESSAFISTIFQKLK